jgi:hypothetical protein
LAKGSTPTLTLITRSVDENHFSKATDKQLEHPVGMEKRKKFIGFDKYNGEDEKTFH